MENTVHIHRRASAKNDMNSILLDMESNVGGEWWICTLAEYNNFGEYIVVESEKENCVRLFTQEMYDICQNYVYKDGWFIGYDDDDNIELEYLKCNNLEMFLCEETFKSYLMKYNYIALEDAAIILQKVIVDN